MASKTSRKASEKEVPIYERLAPNECLIISKTSKELIVACNVGGEIKVKRVPIPQEE